MPDNELFRLASQKKLRDPEVLKAQVRRMIADPRSRALSSSFLGQWLGFESLGAAINPDGKVFPSFDANLSNAMKSETILTFEHLVKKELSLLNLIDTKHTYLNEQLAKHYGISGITGERMRVVSLRDKNRGGLLGMGSVLTATSTPTRTSPVIRGIWVLETMLGDRIPEAPADVPELNEKAAAGKQTTLRKELELHRNNPSCARCHDKIDPIGFGLENFDGFKFSGVGQLKAWLIKHRKEEFIKTISKNMLSYALGREIHSFDQGPLDVIYNNIKEENYSGMTLIEEIVISHPFLHQSKSNEFKINE